MNFSVLQNFWIKAVIPGLFRIGRSGTANTEQGGSVLPDEGIRKSNRNGRLVNSYC